VVAGGDERGGESLVEGEPVVFDGGGFSVHKASGTDYTAAESLSNGLVSEADAQNGDEACEASDGLEGDARFVGGAGAR
jgi:hypothetical protein